jgi:hypothetical protein
VEETWNLYEYDISVSGVGCCARPIQAACEAYICYYIIRHTFFKGPHGPVASHGLYYQ